LARIILLRERGREGRKDEKEISSSIGGRGEKKGKRRG